MKKGKFRFTVVTLVVLAIVYYLVPLVWPNMAGKGFTSKQLNLGLDLQGGMRLVLGVDSEAAGISKEQEDQVVETSLEIIRNRVDEFGVTEPVIQRVGSNRIAVSLPGVKDFDRAEKLIGKTALLEFKLLGSGEALSDVIGKIDNYLQKNKKDFPELTKKFVGEEKSLAESVLDDGKEKEKESESRYSKLFSVLVNYQGANNLIVVQENVELLKKVLAVKKIAGLLPSEYSFNLGKTTLDKNDVPIYTPLFFLQKRVQLSGKYLKSADVRVGQEMGGIQTNEPYVSLEFDSEGAKKFANITSDNLHKRLAIVLDDIVYMAPTINSRIADGKASITGSMNMEEVQNLVIVLRAGNLPAPVTILERRSVGPTLGADSIKAGFLAGVLGLSAILLFMIFYYRLSGILAIIAVAANILFILAALTMFSATLTMPGIAGIVLTIGMAVDGCVLIFERIREELDLERPVSSAISSGFQKAFWIIMDANVTTLITAAVLYKFGSGPIRGFAVTLSIGIVGSLFSTLILVKLFFERVIRDRAVKKLSI